MLNRYAKFSISRWANSATYNVRIKRANRPHGDNFYRNITMSSLKRLHYIDDTYLMKIIYNPHPNLYVYEWQPPTLHLIPYQCSNCNEIVWSTNDALYIRHYCESVEELLEMVRKS